MTLGEKLKIKSNKDQMYNCTVRTVSETIAEKEIAEINWMQMIYSHQKWNIKDYTYTLRT